MARKTHCRQGHPFNKMNTLWARDARHGKLVQVCMRCQSDKQRRRYHTDPEYRARRIEKNRLYRERKRAERKSMPRQRKTHCKSGHAFTPKNTGWTRDCRHGGLVQVCRTCRAAYEVAKYRDKPEHAERCRARGRLYRERKRKEREDEIAQARDQLSRTHGGDGAGPAPA